MLRKRPSELGAKFQTELSLSAKGSTAPSTPTKAHTIPVPVLRMSLEAGRQGRSTFVVKCGNPKLFLSGLLSSPSSSASEEAEAQDAQSPIFPRYAPSGMRAPTTPTAHWKCECEIVLLYQFTTAQKNAYTATPNSSASSSANPNTNINPQIQPSHPSTHGHGYGTMASAKALLRRVRSGSSLRPGMGVHPEEETDGAESLGSVAGAAVLGDGRKRQWGEVEGCDDGAYCARLGFGDLTNLPPQPVVPAGSAAAATVNGSRESTGVETTNVQASSSGRGPATRAGPSCIGLSGPSSPPLPPTSPRTLPNLDVAGADAIDASANNTKNSRKTVPSVAFTPR